MWDIENVFMAFGHLHCHLAKMEGWDISKSYCRQKNIRHQPHLLLKMHWKTISDTVPLNICSISTHGMHERLGGLHSFLLNTGGRNLFKETSITRQRRESQNVYWHCGHMCTTLYLFRHTNRLRQPLTYKFLLAGSGKVLLHCQMLYMPVIKAKEIIVHDTFLKGHVHYQHTSLFIHVSVMNVNYAYGNKSKNLWLPMWWQRFQQSGTQTSMYSN